MNACSERHRAACLTTLLSVYFFIAYLPVSLRAQSSPPPTSGSGAAVAPVTPPVLPPAVKKAAAQFEHAAGLQKALKLDAALSAYKEFLQEARAAQIASNTLLPAYENMLAIYRARNDLHGAEQALQEIVKIQPSAVNYAELATTAAMEQHLEPAQKAAEKALSLKPAQAVAGQAHFALGQIAIARREYVVAEKEYALAAKLVPENFQAHYDYALTLVHQKKYPLAIAEAEKARKLTPKLVRAHLFVAAIKQEANDIDGAARAYADALKLDPRNQVALFHRALALQLLGKINDAITAYVAELAVYPEDIDAQFNLGQLYYRIHNYSAAETHFAKVEKLADHKTDKDNKDKYRRAVASLAVNEAEQSYAIAPGPDRNRFVKLAEEHSKAAITLDPQNTQLLLSLAELYRRNQRYEDALYLYNKMLALNPNSREAVFGMADVYMMQTDADKALVVWKAYQKRKPDDPISYAQCVRLFEGKERWAEAIEENQSLAKLEPQNGSVQIALAHEYEQSKQLEQAETAYKAVFTLDAAAKDQPANLRPAAIGNRQAWRIAAWRGLAKIEEGRNHFEAAIDYLNHVKAEQAAIAKRDQKQPEPEVYMDISRLYQLNKQPDKALNELVNLTQAASNSAEAYASLGLLYEEQGKTDEAVSALRKASQRAKDPLAYGLQGADLYRKHGNLLQAVAEYEILLPKFAHDPRLLAPLAQTLEQAGKDDRALTIYVALLQANPKLRWVEDKEAIILARQKRYDEAIRLREKHLKNYPADRQTYADLEQLYIQQGKSPQYLTWLQAQVGTQLNNAALMDALINAYIKGNRAEEGWAYLRALMDKPDSKPETQQVYIQILSQHNRTADIAAIDGRIAAANPKDLEAPVIYADALIADRRKPEAIKVFLKQIARTDLSSGQKLMFRRQLAQRLQDPEDSAAAIEQYQEIVRRQPKDYESVSALVRLLGQDPNRLNDLIATCDSILKTPNYLPALRMELLCTLGGAYEKQNNKAEARQQYQEALKIDPTNVLATNGLKRLSN